MLPITKARLDDEIGEETISGLGSDLTSDGGAGMLGADGRLITTTGAGGFEEGGVTDVTESWLVLDWVRSSATKVGCGLLETVALVGVDCSALVICLFDLLGLPIWLASDWFEAIELAT